MAQNTGTSAFPKIYDDMHTVLVVHRCGSMACAASELGTTVSTVSRRIDRLQGILNVRPFVKSGRGWKLNPSLEKFVEAFESAHGYLTSELHSLQNQDADIPVEIKIGGPPFVLAHVLVPRIGDLAANPSAIVPVLERRFNETGLGSQDIAIVFTPPEMGRLKVRRCANLAFSVYAPEGWSIGDGWVNLLDQCADLIYEESRAFFGREPTLRVDSFSQAFGAMKRLGLAGLLPEVVAREDGDLRRLDTFASGMSRDLFVIHHESRSTDPRMRDTLNWLAKCLADVDARHG